MRFAPISSQKTRPRLVNVRKGGAAKSRNGWWRDQQPPALAAFDVGPAMGTRTDAAIEGASTECGQTVTVTQHWIARAG